MMLSAITVPTTVTMMPITICGIQFFTRVVLHRSHHTPRYRASPAKLGPGALRHDRTSPGDVENLTRGVRMPNLPDATHLALGFDSRSGFSPGTAKTSLEGLAQGGKVRHEGRIISVPLAYKTRRIDFGDGEKLAMTIPWGDISTAYATTGIPNIEVYIPGSPAMVARARRANWFKWLFGTGVVQSFIKRRIEKRVEGPSAAKRDAQPSYVWGEVTNALGDKRTARIKTANGYSLTVTGALAVVEHLLAHEVPGGTCTPAKLIGPDLVTRLPGSGPIQIA
jgi:short subunit dehydrogenase-like uncharacterized protein